MNILPFKNRTIDHNRPVYVYRNLSRRGVVWSIKQNGVVVGHCYGQIALRDPDFIVNSSGKTLALQTQQRNVHAMVKGVVFDGAINDGMRRFTYKPFDNNGFVYCNTGKPIRKSNYAIFNSSGAYVA